MYLPSVGWTILLVLLGERVCELTVSRRSLRVAFAVVAIVWTVASVAALQLANERWRRNGVMSVRIIDAIVKAVPKPQAGTVFILDGMASLIAGATPSIRQPVMLFGLPEALRMRFGGTRLDVVFPEAPSSKATDPARPIVRLRWNARANTFER